MKEKRSADTGGLQSAGTASGNAGGSDGDAPSGGTGIKADGSRKKSGNSGCRNYGRCYHKAEERQSTLGTIAKTAAEAGLKPPAVIVIGEVAALDLMPQELSFSSGELQGLHIGVTGTEAFPADWRLLREKGAV